jgi:hypothetical protein
VGARALRSEKNAREKAAGLAHCTEALLLSVLQDGNILLRRFRVVDLETLFAVSGSMKRMGGKKPSAMSLRTTLEQGGR